MGCICFEIVFKVVFFGFGFLFLCLLHSLLSLMSKDLHYLKKSEYPVTIRNISLLLVHWIYVPTVSFFQAEVPAN